MNLLFLSIFIPYSASENTITNTTTPSIIFEAKNIQNIQN